MDTPLQTLRYILYLLAAQEADRLSIDLSPDEIYLRKELLKEVLDHQANPDNRRDNSAQPATATRMYSPHLRLRFTLKKLGPHVKGWIEGENDAGNPCRVTWRGHSVSAKNGGDEEVVKYLVEQYLELGGIMNPPESTRLTTKGEGWKKLNWISFKKVWEKLLRAGNLPSDLI
ncbi:MAG: hypothetical protein IH953_08350 [Chloroflexi bacterium]|nr:hypothetical protein [Chloroflexota bacterium]